MATQVFLDAELERLRGFPEIDRNELVWFFTLTPSDRVREQTRTDHLGEVAKLLGWRPAGELEFKDLDQYLSARALEHESPTQLFRLACDYLRSAQTGCYAGWLRVDPLQVVHGM